MHPTPPRATADADAAWSALHRQACAPYRAAGRFAWHFARGKLGRDPVFRGLLQRGDLCTPPGTTGQPAAEALRVLDIGCGQGLLASLLQACADAQRDGRWPADWPRLPPTQHYTGIELMPRDIARAQQALQALPLPLQWCCGDMCQTDFPRVNRVVILDVLHYVDHAAQQQVLQRVHQALQPGGRLLLRVGDMASGRGFRISQWVDHVVTLTRGHRVPPTWGRPLDAWLALLRQLGFVPHSVPMSQGTPFANVLLVADRP